MARTSLPRERVPVAARLTERGEMDEKELDKLKESIFGKLRSSIVRGDKAEALAILEEIDRNRDQYRGMFLTWIDALLSFIADRLGEDAVFESMRSHYSRVGKPQATGQDDPAIFDQASAEERLRKRAYLWTSLHGSDIDDIQEDSDKFIITVRCPSGGEVRSRERFGKTERGYPWSYGEPGLAYYCTHCPATFEIMSIEEFGYPAWVNLPQPDGRCVQYVYKDLRNVPEEYYKRVGKEKPDTLKVNNMRRKELKDEQSI